MNKINQSAPSHAKGNALIISKADKKSLSKNQMAFNKLTLQLEKAKRNIENKRHKLDFAVKLFANELSPLKIKLIEERKEMLFTLWDLYKSDRLSKTDQRYFKSIIREHLQSLFSVMTDEPDAKLKTIFTELEKMEYDKAEAIRNEALRVEMIAILKSMKVDLSQIDRQDEKALEAKIIEEQQKQKFRKEQADREQAFNQQQAKKTSNKQAKMTSDKKPIDYLKQKNLSSIYKKLSKLYHPDLERDEGKRAAKVILMQELTAAYESNDLYTLLNLELKWLQTDTSYLENLEDEKLFSYLQVLKDQINTLMMQKDQLLFQPNYTILIHEFGSNVGLAPVDTIRFHVSEAKQQIFSFQENISLLKSDKALRYMKQLIKEWKSQVSNY